VRRILVVRKDNIGDVLCTTPALGALRRSFPDAHLAILVSAQCRAAVAGNPDVDEVLTYTKAKHRSGWGRLAARWELMRVIRGLRRRRFDLAISMCRSFSQSSAWLAYASGAPWRLGYLAPPAHPLGFFLNLGKGGRPTALHEVDCCLELLASADIPAAGRKLTLVPDPDVRAAVERKLGEAGAPAGRRLALLHISNRREDRQWPLPFFTRAADLLREQLGLSILLSWSPGDPRNPLFPGDDAKAEEVAAQMRMRPILLRTPTLEEMIAAVSLSDLVLTTDGGLMHIAAALDIPQVVPFGPTDPGHWGPVSQRSVVLQRGGRADNISVEEVVEAAAAVLSRSSGMRAPSAARFPDTMQAVPKGEG
jgi:ADP-heptose:LPS heptosyltransferase